MRRLPALAALLLGCPGGGGAPPALPATAGPVLGPVTTSSAAVWIRGPAPLELRSWPAGEPSRATVTALTPDPASFGAAVGRIEGLVPGSAWEYEVLVGGTATPTARGRFRTAPDPAAPARVVVALASCMNPIRRPSQPSWFLVRAARPDLLVLLGDNVYSDSTDPRVAFEHHLRQRTVREFAAVVRDVPVLATWDDHDFAGKDSDRTAPGKEAALSGFRAVFPDPGAGLPGTPGTFHQARWGPVELWVLDVRTHRDPNAAPDGEEKTILGAAQERWLVEGLAASTAPFKLICSGSTFAADPNDGWSRFGRARARLFGEIARRRIGGVLLASGDLHRCQVDRHDPAPGGYPLIEVISSGIGLGGEDGFATIAFDTTGPEPAAEIEVVLGDATVPVRQRIPLADLQPR